MRNLPHTIAALFALFIALPFGLAAQTEQAVEKTGDPYTEWKGTEHPWPQTQPLPMSISVKWESAPEDPRYQVFRIGGEGLTIATRSISPFIIDETAPIKTDWKGSVVLYDSRSQSGMLCFTHFAKDEFLPKVDKDSIMGYAKSLAGQTNAEKGVEVEIIAPPSELDRKAVMLRSRPLFITWRMSDRNTGANFQRTDYMLELDDKSLLVISIVASPDEEPAIRSAAYEMLRFAYIEDKE